MVTFLLTGGAGSLGRRLARELLKPEFEATSIRILDNHEESLARMKLQMKDNRLRWLLGDICDQDRMNAAMENVDVCFALAAAKHVDLCENNPQFSLKVNVIGTQVTIDAALHANIDKLLYISSDKACQPSSLYGMCKKISECLTLDAKNYKGDKRTKLSICRPPNYVQSDGSVWDIWSYQKANGLPITLTDKRCIRYFLTFEEIVMYIVKSMKIMKGGEIFIPRTCKPTRIYDLAKTISDNIEIIGLRPGEKLEEMLIDPMELERAEITDGMWIVQS